MKNKKLGSKSEKLEKLENSEISEKSEKECSTIIFSKNSKNSNASILTNSSEIAKEKNRRVFWLDGKYKAKGGYYWRGFDLVRFIEKVEKNVGEVVGIAIDPDTDNKEKYSANIEFIVKPKQKKEN